MPPRNNLTQEQMAAYNQMNAQLSRNGQHLMTPNDYQSAVYKANAQAVNSALQNAYQEALKMYASAGESAANVQKPPTYDSVSNLDMQAFVDTYAKGSIPNTYNVNDAIKQIYDEATKAGIPNVPSVPNYSKIFINQATAQAAIDSYAKSIPATFDVKTALQKAYDAAIKAGLTNVPKPPTITTVFTDQSKAQSVIDNYVKSLPQIYDVNTALTQVYQSALKQGITGISAPTKVTTVISNQAQANKIIDDYVKKINSSVTTSKVSTNSYDPNSAMQKMYDTLTTSGYANVPPVTKVTGTFTDQASAQKVVDTYANLINNTALKTGFEVARNQIIAGDKGGAMATASKYGGTAKIDPQKTSGYNFVNELNDSATSVFQDAQRANPALTEYQWRQQYIQQNGAANADSFFFGDRPDVFSFDKDGSFALLTMQSPNQSYIQPEVVGNRFSEKYASTTNNMVNPKNVSSSSVVSPSKPTVVTGSVGMTTSQALNYLNSSQYKAGLATQGQITSTVAVNSTPSAIVTGNSALAKYNRAVQANANVSGLVTTPNVNGISNAVQVTNPNGTLSILRATGNEKADKIPYGSVEIKNSNTGAWEITKQVVEIGNRSTGTPKQESIATVVSPSKSIPTISQVNDTHVTTQGFISKMSEIDKYANEIRGVSAPQTIILAKNGSVIQQLEKPTYNALGQEIKLVTPVTLNSTGIQAAKNEYAALKAVGGVPEGLTEDDFVASQGNYTRGYDTIQQDIANYDNSNPLSITGAAHAMNSNLASIMSKKGTSDMLAGAVPFKTVDEQKIADAEAKGGWWGAISSESLKLDSLLRGGLTTDAIVSGSSLRYDDKMIGSLMPNEYSSNFEKSRTALFTSLGVEDQRVAISKAIYANPAGKAGMGLLQEAYDYTRAKPVETAAIAGSYILLGAGINLAKTGIAATGGFLSTAIEGTVERSLVEGAVEGAAPSLVSKAASIVGEDAVRAIGIKAAQVPILGSKLIIGGINTGFEYQIGSGAVNAAYGQNGQEAMPDVIGETAKGTLLGGGVGYATGGYKGMLLGAGAGAASSFVSSAKGDYSTLTNLKGKPVNYEGLLNYGAQMAVTLPLFKIGDRSVNGFFDADLIEENPLIKPEEGEYGTSTKTPVDTYLKNLRGQVGAYSKMGNTDFSPSSFAISKSVGTVGKGLSVFGKATGIIKTSIIPVGESPNDVKSLGRLTRGATQDALVSGKISGASGDEVNLMSMPIIGNSIGIDTIPKISPKIVVSQEYESTQVRVPFTDKTVDLSVKLPLSGTRVGIGFETSKFATGEVPRALMGLVPNAVKSGVKSFTTDKLDKMSLKLSDKIDTTSDNKVKAILTARKSDVDLISTALKGVMADKQQVRTRAELNAKGRVATSKNQESTGVSSNYMTIDDNSHFKVVSTHFMYKGGNSRLPDFLTHRIHLIDDIDTVYQGRSASADTRQFAKTGGLKTETYKDIGKDVISQADASGRPVGFHTPKFVGNYFNPENEALLGFGGKESSGKATVKRERFSGIIEGKGGRGFVIATDTKYGDAPFKTTVLGNIVENAKYNWRNSNVFGKSEYVAGMSERANRRAAEISGNALSRPQEFTKNYSTNPVEHTNEVEKNMEKIWNSSKKLQSKYTLQEFKIAGRMHDNMRLYETETYPIPHDEAMMLAMKKGLINDPEFQSLSKASQKRVAEAIGVHTDIKPVTLENMAKIGSDRIKYKVENGKIKLDKKGKIDVTVEKGLKAKALLKEAIMPSNDFKRSLANADRLARAAEHVKGNDAVEIAKKVKTSTLFRLPLDEGTEMDTLINKPHAQGGVQPNPSKVTVRDFANNVNRMMADERASLGSSHSENKFVSSKKMPISSNEEVSDKESLLGDDYYQKGKDRTYKPYTLVPGKSSSPYTMVTGKKSSPYGTVKNQKYTGIPNPLLSKDYKGIPNPPLPTNAKYKTDKISTTTKYGIVPPKPYGKTPPTITTGKYGKTPPPPVTGKYGIVPPPVTGKYGITPPKPTGDNYPNKPNPIPPSSFGITPPPPSGNGYYDHYDEYHPFEDDIIIIRKKDDEDIKKTIPISKSNAILKQRVETATYEEMMLGRKSPKQVQVKPSQKNMIQAPVQSKSPVQMPTQRRPPVSQSPQNQKSMLSVPKSQARAPSPRINQNVMGDMFASTKNAKSLKSPQNGSKNQHKSKNLSKMIR